MSNANDIQFHPSALGDLMTGVAKGCDVEKSVTCKRKLVQIFRQEMYGRSYQYTNKYTEKGVVMEQDGITLHAIVRRDYFVKNTVRLVNEFFTGEPDIILEDETIDIKCSWSLDTFPSPLIDKVDSDYEYQGIGYMDLTGKKKHTVAYCLVNAPANLIQREKESLFYKMNCPDMEDPNYRRALLEIERNMIFDMAAFRKANPNTDLEYGSAWLYDIPAKERVVEFTVHADEKKLKAVHDRLRDCRQWMNANLFKVKELAA